MWFWFCSPIPTSRRPNAVLRCSVVLDLKRGPFNGRIRRQNGERNERQHCSADCQSAVSPIVNRQGGGGFELLDGRRIANPRYSRLPVGATFRRRGAMSDELPQGWASVALGELTKPSRPALSPKENPHLPFVGMEQVESQTRRLLGTLSSSEMKSTAFHFQPGDVLYGKLRPYLNKVHCADLEGLCSSEFIVMPPTARSRPSISRIT